MQGADPLGSAAAVLVSAKRPCGSHTFLTHEFISAIIEDRWPTVYVYEAIAFTLPGIIAHRSALRGGEVMKIQDYGKAPA